MVTMVTLYEKQKMPLLLKALHLCVVWWGTLIISSLGQLKQKCHEFKTNLSYIVWTVKRKEESRGAE